MNKETRNLIVLSAIAVIITVMFISSYRPTQTILAASRCYIDPQYGYEDPQTGEWKGSYWIVLSTTGTYGDHVFYRFDEEEVERFGENFVEEGKLLPKSTIEINVIVGQPYIKRTLAQTPYTICKPVYASGGGNVYLAEHYDYNIVTGEWEKQSGSLPQQDVVVKETTSVSQTIVPLRISATKIDADGNQVSLQSGGQTEVVLEVAGAEALIPLWFENPSDSDEKFKFKLEGLLGTGESYMIPDLAIFDDGTIFEKTGSLLSDIRYSTTNPTSYVQYWYGEYRPIEHQRNWQEHSGGATIYTKGSSITPYPPGIFTETQWITSYQYPARMWIYSDPPGHMGLISYLESRNREIRDWEIDAWGLGYEITDTEIKVNIPYNSWNWMYTLEISTELADTYVWRPTYADGQIKSANWASSGTKDATISDEDQLEITVGNVGTVGGNLRIRLTTSPNDAPLLIEGAGKFFVVGGEHTFVIQAKNLGPEVKTDGSLLLELVNDAGDIRDTDTVTFTLLPITGVTTLNVKLEEKGDSTVSLSGMIVSVQYGEDSLSEISRGGWASFSMGAYQGAVTITVEESMNYYGAIKESVVSTGSQTEIVELEKKGIILPDGDGGDYTLPILILVTGAVIITVLVVFRKRIGRLV